VTETTARPQKETIRLADEGSSGRVPPDPFSRISSPILRRAARAVAASWEKTALDASEVEAIEELILIARAVASEEVRPRVVPETMASGILRRRLLDLLSSATTTGWTKGEPPPAAEMIALLTAFDRVRELLEPAWDQRFAAYLSAPTGFELLVEVAHDLRSPLTSILFLSEVLQKQQSGEINDLQRRQLGIIYSAALGLISVASDVIEFARGGDQLIDLEPSPFSVTETFESVADIIRPLAEEKGLAIRSYPPTIDQRRGYPVALNRVLLNLTTNALKFTDEGVVEIVAREKDDSRIEFSVRDTGCGIDPEVVDSLYQPFRRSGTAKQYHFSGSGLGLVITRRLVEAMGSRLEFETEPRWGTRFFFELSLPPAYPELSPDPDYPGG
jgi:signal transduction histidine kinase